VIEIGKNEYDPTESWGAVVEMNASIEYLCKTISKGGLIKRGVRKGRVVFILYALDMDLRSRGMTLYGFVSWFDFLLSIPWSM